MASISESMDQIVYVGIGIFVLILILSIDYSGYGISNQATLLSTGFSVQTHTTTQSQGAFDFNVLSNSLVLTALGGTTSWISASNPLYIDVSGLTVQTVATNTVQAVPSSAQTTLSFSITSSAVPQTLTTSANFYSINSIKLYIPGPNELPPTAAPGMTATVNQLYYAVTYLSHPVTYSGNSQTANKISNVLVGAQIGAYYNYSNYGDNGINAFGGALQLAIFALVFIAVILAVLGALRGGGTVASGGFLGR